MANVGSTKRVTDGTVEADLVKNLQADINSNF
jgi:hypothetical protein